MSLMEKMGKTGEQSNFKKWVVYGLFAVVAFMILREIFFWSIFNEVMSGVKSQTEGKYPLKCP